MQIQDTIEHEKRIQVYGEMEGKPFELNFYPEESVVTVDGSFNDQERAQIFSEWEMRYL